ncbi:Putative 1-phosphatidylinositol-3-phosphate 5-kinase FAB1D [Zea mays]|uniref:Putative 1-phosphatidylinositol-3-phosphate 5-kinase FAB1D n=2 Tax=Zea mays TaxID=4577 RepID=A0A1D6LVQ5_MAIZE|nr:Putative 1-phosphatidylinositol-3-phosphate 5-kinase FAB1D [Zea mays]
MTVNGKVTLKDKYSVTVVYDNQFFALRKKCCPSELAYITSLSRCKKWNAQGGKSKAYFVKTTDDRFIIKQINKTEFESFIKFAPDYFKHVYHSLDTGSQTCLAKILGIYQVKQIKHGKEVKIDLMVMENLLFGHNISRIYDLKGAIFSRRVTDSNDHDTVYLDQNYVEDMSFSPIYIGGRTKHLLQRAIWNDTSFLTSVNVMDYSLLVGVDKEKHELVFGIIDYLRQYT